MRIAIISDIHFGRKAATNDFTFPGEALDLEETMHAKPLLQGMVDILTEAHPDYLLVAGDLTSTGSPLEFKYCYDRIRALGETLGIPSNKTVFCLGNHDLDWRVSDITGLYTNPYHVDDKMVLEDYYQQLSYSAPVALGFQDSFSSVSSECYDLPMTGVLEFEDCVIFVLNSSHKSSKKQQYKHGYLSTEQLDWFRNAATKYSAIGKLKIVLLHHHPHNYEFPLPVLDISTLEEGSEVNRICGENGIDIVIHGHRHQPQARTIFTNGWKKPVAYICCGSLSVNAQGRPQGIPNTFHLIDYDNTKTIQLNNYSYSEITGWSPSIYSSETPVDGQMLLGKTVTEDDAKSIIRDLPINELISYDSLPKKLHYLPIPRLMKYIRETHPGYIVMDAFPKDILIFSKEV